MRRPMNRQGRVAVPSFIRSQVGKYFQIFFEHVPIGMDSIIFFSVDRIYRINWIFLIFSQFPDETVSTNPLSAEFNTPDNYLFIILVFDKITWL